MWIDNSIFYHFYPLGFCGAPKENDGVTLPRIKKVIDWTEHLKKLGVTAVYFSPVFESDKHGYDTRDYYKIDCRLGTNEDFAEVTKSLHANGIKVVLDGVFNHVGRGFWAFQDVLKNRENSKYKDWFHINFGGNSNYNDGFWYEGWEGHFELVKLNLHNDEVCQHIFSAIKKWVEEYDIDGLRLDVAYCLDKGFLEKLRSFCDGLKPEFALIGEILFGDYNTIVNDRMLHSCTNYECYKGIFSSFNDMNMFEICHSLNRQFGKEGSAIYKGKHLMIFVDNHDVSRIASILKDEKHVPVAYGLLFGMPGIPCIYYGSEWGAKGNKKDGDDALRDEFDAPKWNELTELVAKLAEIHSGSKALTYGSYKSALLTNHQCILEREFEGEKILVALNASAQEFTAKFHISGSFDELIFEKAFELSGEIKMPPYSVQYFKQN